MSPETEAAILRWSEALDSVSYYDLLGTHAGADVDTLQAAYHRFATAFHPDAHGKVAAELRRKLSAIFQRGAEAYRVLRDPRLRLRYDRELSGGQVRLSLEQSLAPPPAVDWTEPLHLHCRSAAAKLAVRNVARDYATADYTAVRRALITALDADGGANRTLQRHLDEVSLLLFQQDSGPGH